MKIAQIAPLEESCPPRLYGGTERIVSFLTEELVRQGHQLIDFSNDAALFGEGAYREQNLEDPIRRSMPNLHSSAGPC